MPTGYSASTSYPLIIFLHGMGENGTDNTVQLNNNANGALALVSSANQAAFPCFMMAPQANPSAGWNAKTCDQIIAAVRLETATFNIDPDRIYVTGLSMGGNGTVTLVNHAPYVFACAVPMSGWGDTNFEKNCAMPFWVFHAANDGTVGVNGSDNIVGNLRTAGRPVIYTRYATGGHGIWPVAYTTTELLPWMIAQRRNHPVAGTPQVTVTNPAAAVTAVSATTLNIAGTATLASGLTQVTYTAKDWEAGPGDDLDSTKRTVITGTTAWSQAAASLNSNLGIVVAIGPSPSMSLGGTTRISRTFFVSKSSSNQTAPAVVVTTPSASGAATTAASLITLGGSASAGGGKMVSEVTWSSDRGGQVTAISSTYGSASLTWSITDLGLSPGVNIITVTVRDSLGKLTTTTYSVTVGSVGPSAPELDVSRGAVAITDGGSDAISGTTAGTAASMTYTFTNSGTASLGITTPVVISGASNCAVMAGTQPAASVAAGASTSLILTVTPAAAGAWTFAMSVANTDANESPYNWTVTGTADSLSSSAPRIPDTDSSGSNPRGSAQSDSSGGCGLGSGLGLILTVAALSLRQLRGRR